MAAYTANCENADIPCVLLGFADQEALARQIALSFGQPNIRYVATPRVGQGSERVAVFWDAMINALTEPLTDKEKETGLFIPPPDPRICFTGTLDDAQEFYQKTSPIASCKNCPIAQWTDGIPIIIPTEEKVAEMLTGTSHSPEEYIVYPNDRVVTFSTSGIRMTVKAGDPVYYLPLAWGTTVEKIAVNCVMAGCTPQCLPVLLATYESGSPFATTNTPVAYTLSISGPIVKELGINAKQPYHSGNPGTMSIGRAYQLMLINVGGATQGSSNTNLGNPVNRTGLCVAEDADSLPTGWLPDNQIGNVTPYGTTTSRPLTAQDSIVRTGGGGSFVVCNFAPSAFGNLNQGKGPIARYLGVEGTPGKYNILEYLLPNMIGQVGIPSLPSMIISPGIAQSLYDYGFTSKASIGPWLRQATVMPIGEIEKWGWYDFNYSGGTRVESTTGMRMIDLPDNFLYYWGGASISVVVTNALGDECIIWGAGAGGGAHLIDAWR